MLEEQRPHEWVAALAGRSAVLDEVRDQRIAHLDDSAEAINELRSELPRLARRRPVAARMRAERTEGQPAQVEIRIGRIREAADEVRPEAEAAQAQRQPAPQRAQHPAVVRLAVAGEMQRVALRARPGGAGVLEALAGDLAGGFCHGAAVAERVEVVLGESGRVAAVDAAEWGGLAEV